MSKIPILLCVFLLLVSSRQVISEETSSPRFDVLIQGGTLIDGTGTPRRVADVGILDGKIAAIGKLSHRNANTIIIAKGLVVCPGFIDLHNHADRELLQFPLAENYLRQGTTSLVCGNCGGSPTDLKSYFQEVQRKGLGPNIAMLIGHGSVRESVMGRVNAAPTSTQLREIKRRVRQAMTEGAVGLSTSLRYGTGAYASTEEIAEVAREIAPFGGFYATHMRDEGTRILESLEEALEIGKRASVPVHISHHKISAASVFGLTRQTLAQIDAARKAGRDVTLDQYPYGAGSSNMTFYVPQWSLSGGLDAFRDRLKDPNTKQKILTGVKELLVRKLYERDQHTENEQHTALALSRIRVARAPHEKSLNGKTLTDILQDRKTPTTLENGCELLLELITHDTRGINHTLDDRPGGDVERVMQHSQTCIASDGAVFAFGENSPHPRSYGCFPRVLGHYVRERKLLSLELAIHKMTALPARRLGWKTRGELKPNSWADVVVFNPQTITDTATFAKPHQYATGIRHVLIQGQFVINDGELTAQRPGQILSLKDRIISTTPPAK